MSAPTPAAVRAALEATETTAPTESLDMVGEMAREKGCRPSAIVAGILSDHIRAIAAEMRAEAKATRLNTVDPFMSIAVRNAEISEAQLLERFADRLEGRES